MMLGAVCALTAVAAGAPPAKPNILHLVADDMRPQLGCYGHAFMKTPHLDELSATGLHFDFAYTNFAYCAPSRNSFMSGRRPDRTRALNFRSTFRECRSSFAPGCGPGASWVTMPQFFKNNGYFTSSAGKIFHDGMDDPISWTYPSNQTAWIHCYPGDVMDTNGNYCGLTENSTVPYTDEDLSLAEGLKRIQLAHASKKPWWVSIGNHRPHTVFRVPQGFHGTELYPKDSPGGDPVKPCVNCEAPIGAPWMSGNWQGGDINDPAHSAGTYQRWPTDINGCPDCIIPNERAIEYRRWYYAAVSWSDHKLGEAMALLETLDVADRTITVFHSDHGWQLGELNEWSKKTNTELATHIPLLIRVPWIKASVGARTKVKMELVDLCADDDFNHQQQHRTLAGLAGLDEQAIEPTVQGVNLASVFDSPADPPAQFKTKRAFSQIGRCNCGIYATRDGPTQECGGNACCQIPITCPPNADPEMCDRDTNSSHWTMNTVGTYDYMGYTMRTDSVRFTVWLPFDDDSARPIWPDLDDMGERIELYDLSTDDGRNFDFDGYSLNLANTPAYASTVQELWAELKAEVSKWL